MTSNLGNSWKKDVRDLATCAHKHRPTGNLQRRPPTICDKARHCRIVRAASGAADGAGVSATVGRGGVVGSDSAGTETSHDAVVARRLHRRHAVHVLGGRGAYCDLLFFQWQMGGLPDDVPRQARMLGIFVDEFRAVLPALRSHFHRDPETGLVVKRPPGARTRVT